MQNYVINEKILGKGSFGVVKLAFDIVNLRHVAVKIMPLREKNIKVRKITAYSDNVSLGKSFDDVRTSPRDSIDKEIKIIRYLDHPHIVKYYDCDIVDNSYHIYMEYIKHGTLYDYVLEHGHLEEDVARNIFAQLISALEYCHGNLISHRDLKLENILLAQTGDNPVIKLTDFGLANFVKLSSLHNTFCGSPDYAPPEIFRKQRYNPLIADIWSAGICLYTMVCGHFPWSYKNIADMLASNNVKFPPSVTLSDDLMDLIRMMLVRNPKERITLDGIKCSLWLQSSVLPSYLPDTQPVTTIDLRLVEKIASLGFDKKELLYSIAENTLTQSTAIYHILLQNHTLQEKVKNNDDPIMQNNDDKKINKRSKTEMTLTKNEKKTIRSKFSPIFGRRKHVEKK